MAFAALTIDLDARLASFEDGLRRATRAAESSGQAIGSAFGLAKTALGGLVAGLSAGVIVSFAKELIGAAAALDDMAEKTGAAVERLSELQQVAKIGGADFEGVTDILVRLSRALAGNGTEDETKGVGAALKAIGLNADELRSKDPATALKDIAIRLNEYADSGSKTAVVTALLGRNAANYLPFLKDLATETGITAKVTAEQAAEAEKLEKALNRLSLESQNAKQSFLLGLVPALNNIIEQFKVAKDAAGGLLGAIVLLAGTSNANAGAQIDDIAKKLTKLRETRDGLENPQGFASGLKKFLNTEDIAIVNSQISALEKQQRLLQVVHKQQFMTALGISEAELGGSSATKPKLPDFKVAGAAKTAGGSTANPFDTLIKQLEAESTKVDQISRQFQVLDLIARGHYGNLTEAQKEQAAALARAIDQTKEQAKVEKETADAKQKIQIEADNANKKEKDALEDLRKKYVDLIDPLQKYREQLDEIDKLQDKGVLNPTQATEARFKVNELLDAAAGLNKELEKTKDVSDEVFAKLSSGFEDAVVSGKKLGDVARALGQDFVKIFLRAQVTEPLGKAAKTAFNNIGGSGDFLGGIGKLFGSLLGFANGGSFTVGGSGGTDSQLVAFRASPNERVTVQTPAQQGAGGGINIYQTNDLRGNNDRAWVLARLADTQKATVLAVADAVQRGGQYAAALGR